MERLFFDPSEIVIAMASLYPDWYQGPAESILHTTKVRGDLALASVVAGMKQGFQVILADAGSSDQFHNQLKPLTAQGLIVVPAKPVRAAGRRAAFKAAAELPNAQVIVNTEPEKLDLIERFIPNIVRPVLEGKASIVIPSRDPQTFIQSYPGYMRASELVVNQRYNQILQEQGLMPAEDRYDWFFGPRVFDASLLPLFMEKYEVRADKAPTIKDLGGIRKMINPDGFSNSQFFPVLSALYGGLAVADAEVPFLYPQTQKENEDHPDNHAMREKRKLQRFACWAELIHFIRFLKGDPQSLISNPI